MATNDYKEKYEQALERARQFSEKPYLEDSAGIVEYIFPELKESEDERIRKELLKHLREVASGKSLELSTTDYEKWATWVENQGKITKEWSEMKFNNIQKELQEMVDLKQKTEQGEQNTNHKNMIVKFICKKDWHGIGDYYYGKIYNGYPCEKEQKGYDIYDDNYIPTFCDEDFINEYFTIIEEKQGEQNPIDKIQLGKKYKCIASPRYSTFRIGKIYKPEDKFLCSLMNFCSDCFEPIEDEQKPAWSEEDETALGDALWCCKQAASIAKNENDMGNVWYAETWLKSLKDRVQPQPKPEWSNKDKGMVEAIMWIIEQFETSYDGERFSQTEFTKIKNWLKSLRLQSQWKPSDAQMASITCAVRKMKESACYDSELVSLLNDLKKLKG